MFSVLSALSLLPLLVLSHPTPNQGEWDSVKRSLPARWYQDEGSPVARLFNRQNPTTDGVGYPAIGTPEWSSGYPGVPPDSTKMPQEWTNALNAAVNAGKIPNIPVANGGGQAGPTYPDGGNPGDPATICSATFGCFAPTDIVNAPDGVLALSFDDGPSQGSDLLYGFLGPNHIPSTHFMIGSNILANPQLFNTAFNTLGADIAVHTWSHRYMTELSNLDAVAELGWTMEIIKNSTGGRLPRFWRPPYGDVDNRIRAIALEVFGLQTIIWNHDTLDWSLTTGGTTAEAVSASLTQWLTGPKSPGLLILEHELTPQSSQSFIDAYPLMVSTGWNITTATRIEGHSVYFNAKDSISPVQKIDGVLGYQYTNLPTTTSSSIIPSSTVPTSTMNSTNTNQSNKNGSSRSIASKFTGLLGAVFLTVLFYAW